MISIKNLSKTFNKNIHAVQNVDLEIAEGEVVVIVGPSGSGCLLYTSPSPRD